MYQSDGKFAGIVRVLPAAVFCVMVAFSAAATVGLAHAAPACATDGFEALRPQLLVLGSVDVRILTSFLPGGGEGELLLRQKADDQKVNIIRIFETNGSDRNTFRALREPFVLSTKPTPDKLLDNYTKDNSMLIRFVVPDEHPFPLWHLRTFAVVACANDGKVTWGLARARVSYRSAVALICIALLALVYMLITIAITAIRNRDYPPSLTAKWPEFETRRKFTVWEYLDPVRLTADVFNRGSVQKLQILLFSFLVAGMLLSLTLTAGHLSDFSVTVLGLLGISGVGAAVAQTANTTRTRLSFENWGWLVRRKVLPINQAEATGPRWGDLVVTNREFDIYKLQTIIFSLVVAVALLVAGDEKLASFTVPEALLGILGLSQVVYISGIMARPRSIGDLDDALTELRKRETTLHTAVAYNVDAGPDGTLPTLPARPPDPLPALAAREAAAVNARRRYDEQAKQVALMIESALEIEVKAEKLVPELE
jgi:hypothetical protein